jgi:hypothetical protein
VREHPVLDFLMDHQEAFDKGNMKDEPYTVWHAVDFSLTKSDGTILAPGEASWKGSLENYAPFSAHLHEPHYAIIYERIGNGWYGKHLWQPCCSRRKDKKGFK